MKRPWQIWTLFLLCLALVLPAMIWLSVKALELDRAEAAARQQTEEARREEAAQRRLAEIARSQADVARQQAEVQELASSALWRMDWTLTPLVAQEAARPYYVYLPFYPVPGGKEGKGATQLAPSPLLTQPSEFVLLNFQLAPDDSWSSPQNPTGLQCEAAVAKGTPRENIAASADRLQQLQKSVCHEQLLTMLPEELLPPVEVNPTLWTGNTMALNKSQVDNSGITYDLGLKQLSQQLDEQQTGRAQFNAAGQANPPAQTNSPGQPLAIEKDVDPALQQSSASRGGSRGAYSRTPNDAPPRASEPPANSAETVFNFNNDYEANRRDQILRGGNEWQRRNRAYESYAQTQLFQQRQGVPQPQSPLQLISEGVSRPVWVGKNLLLARRVQLADRVLIQGCWLDWPKLKAMLLEEVADLLPGVELEPVLPHTAVTPGRALATLPAQLVLPEPEPAAEPPPVSLAPLADAADQPLSPIRLSLLVAWSCFLLATFAVGILLQGVITLSERRGAFVSAVTHELRTPLTTFRMYAEMLASGMVPSAEQRQQYLETLRVEADRLSHLVENVLSYARLERGKAGGRRENIAVGLLLDRVTPRLNDRADQAGMKLCLEADDELRGGTVSTDPAAVEQILFNLVDNACKYAASAEDRRIHVALSSSAGRARFEVCDHGPGISAIAARRLFRPFSKSVHEAANSAPGVGLGLALSRRLARALGGSLEIVPGKCGAKFVLMLPLA